MEKRKIRLSALQQNTGQIEGLPTNPRQWTKTDIDLLKKSIEETPELLEARGVLVYPLGDCFVIIGGNMRYQAVRELGWEEVTCEVLPEDIPVETLKAMVIKDNGSFGNWDYDSLANEWDDLPLSEWGVPAWEAGGEEAMPEDLDAEANAKPYVLKITFPSSEKQTAFIQAYKDILKEDYGCTMSNKETD